MEGFNPAQFEAAIRRHMMDRLEQGVKVAADTMVEILRATVSGASEADLSKPAQPFLYKANEGRGKALLSRSKAGKWAGAAYSRGGPPGMQSGKGRDSIKFKILSRDDAAGKIVILIGPDASAPGGTHMQSYMLAHDLGIRHGKGAVIQHPWLRSGVKHYLPTFNTVLISAMNE